MGDAVICRTRVLDAIAAHAEREHPKECCGLLLGTDGSIDEALPLPNRAAEPARRYEIDPRDYLAVIKRCRDTPRTVIGAYHSHPRSSAEPSATDRAEAFSEFLYLLAGPVAAGFPPPVRAYRLERGNFRAVPLVPDAEEDSG
jgi:desampylase